MNTDTIQLILKLVDGKRANENTNSRIAFLAILDHDAFPTVTPFDLSVIIWVDMDSEGTHFRQYWGIADCDLRRVGS